MKQYEGPKVEGEDKEASGMCGIIKRKLNILKLKIQEITNTAH